MERTSAEGAYRDAKIANISIISKKKNEGALKLLSRLHILEKIDFQTAISSALLNQEIIGGWERGMGIFKK